MTMTYGEVGVLDRASLENIRDILGVLGGYSLTKIIEAADRGEIDGRWFTHCDSDQHFSSCLLGWGAFVEQVSITDIRLRLGPAEYVTPPEEWGLGQEMVANTLLAEGYVYNIRQGNTPATNPYLAMLQQLAEEEITRRAVANEMVREILRDLVAA